MSLPRLRQPASKKKPSTAASRSDALRSNARNKVGLPQAGSVDDGDHDQQQGTKLGEDTGDVLAKEAEILSLLTVLNAPAMTHELTATLQAVKAALYARDYAQAFGKNEYLRAYCARWVPGRTLAYRDLFSTSDAMISLLQKHSNRSELASVMCIGGGAGSEVLAFASLAKHFRQQEEIEGDLLRMSVTAIDSADWSSVLESTQELVRDRWQLPVESWSLSFRHEDILDTFAGIDWTSYSIITSLFTTNELFAASKVKTLAFLSHLSETCKTGTLLVIAESVGSYSEITIGANKYPLQVVLDQHLAGKAKAWRIVEKDPGRWYRVPEESKKRYQLQLENTHMLLRGYEKL